MLVLQNSRGLVIVRPCLRNSNQQQSAFKYDLHSTVSDAGPSHTIRDTRDSSVPVGKRSHMYNCSWTWGIERKDSLRIPTGSSLRPPGSPRCLFTGSKTQGEPENTTFGIAMRAYSLLFADRLRAGAGRRYGSGRRPVYASSTPNPGAAVMHTFQCIPSFLSHLLAATRPPPHSRGDTHSLSLTLTHSRPRRNRGGKC